MIAHRGKEENTMKRIIAILAVLMIAILTILPMTGAMAESMNNDNLYIVSENGKTVNLRNKPNGTVITRLGVGKPVTLFGDEGNGWTEVNTKVDGKTVKGYVMTQFLSDEDPAEAPQYFTKVDRFKVTVAPSSGESGHVNLRAEATVHSTCLRYLQKGDVLTVIAESNAWYQVRTAAGTTGYVVKAFVNK